MKIKKFTPASTVQSASDAQNKYFQSSGIKIDFKPFIINFHTQSEIISSICWKSSNEGINDEVIISALSFPSYILTNYKKIEYIPLNKGDTVIINGRIFTLDENKNNFYLMEIPCICSEKYALSIAQFLTNTNTNDYFWRICIGIMNNIPICYTWVGVNWNEQHQEILLPVFPKDVGLITLIDDIIPINISEYLVKNNAIYQVCLNETLLELEYIANIQQALIS